ncbi:Alpha-alpha-trehalase [Spraguea lophii 42_110]|uniref:Trehalase n=1 Tax=Spraguea lophii (strain 42_110) TaxID=1358809 RepID=S7XQN7_SPRLO|nr:Alpha-alpha-trehalase [Spraguea lophii 42_110]
MNILFILHSIFSKKRFDDKVENISTYTDINMLIAIQILLPKTDSKDFVDRPTRKPLHEVKREFKKIEAELGLKEIHHYSTNSGDGSLKPKSTKLSKDAYSDYVYNVKKVKEAEMDKRKVKMLLDFVKENFLPVGSDIISTLPIDYKEHPDFLTNIQNNEVYTIGSALNNIWKELSKEKAHLNPGQESTLLSLPHPFIVPGGRFREFYYWDTYWILEGLLVSGMDKSAINILKNFIHIIKTYGYIPNGTRKYYFYRSQPPYFPMMLLKILDIENGKYNDLILSEGLEMAVKEYNFFMDYKSVTVKDKDGKNYLLNYFHVNTDFPRPESFGEDIATYMNQNIQGPKEIFSNLKSGAETGWDYSSRWFLKEDDIATIAVKDQINVDLNAIMYRNELIISTLYSRKGDTKKSLEFYKKSEIRKEAINKVLWNHKEKVWMDFNFITNQYVDRRFYFSNLSPLIYGIQPVEGNAYDILLKYSKPIFGYPGGIPVSGEGKNTGQQWDFPNVWAPHQHMVVEMLLNLNEENMALHVARSFFNSALMGYYQSKAFFEKYDCKNLGFTGGGGEYTPQTGFGWTNGTILSFIGKFGDKLMEENNHTLSYKKIVEELTAKSSVKSSEEIIKEFEKEPESILKPFENILEPKSNLTSPMMTI